MEYPSPHTFHIPVMGLAYTIDSPIKVARYGISSVVSIIEDRLVELMRRHYYGHLNKTYTPISDKEEDYRARRITDYLDLIDNIVKQQVEKIRHSAFEVGSEIVRYFEMLPSESVLRQAYNRMTTSQDQHEKDALVRYLRSQVQAGSIDVNIMTKVDKNNYDKSGNIITDSSDALAALRGYAKSGLKNSSIIFSAGLNPRLYNYLEKISGFEAKGFGVFDKRVVIKVSDYRSALIQGKYLAKKGIWVSEFRIESGLNCGGHAFATEGYLLGPILEEFKMKEAELRDSLFSLYKPVIQSKGGLVFDEPHPIKISVQGGIGTHEEAEFLHKRYNVSSTGWGTPFLLCPEATTVDDETLELLSKAKEEDVVLSHNSPLGVRFNYLRGTSAEKEKLSRISKGKPGSPCTEKHLVSNTEFTTEPICTASYSYQKQKIAQLQSLNLPAAEYEKQYNHVVSKECLCVGLINSAIVKYELPTIKNLEAVTICPGPNIAYFKRIATLQEMADHIYGRINLLDESERPHMFVKELQLNMDYLKEQQSLLNKSDGKAVKDLIGFATQLLNGINYYRELVDEIKGSKNLSSSFDEAENEIQEIIKSVQSA